MCIAHAFFFVNRKFNGIYLITFSWNLHEFLEYLVYVFGIRIVVRSMEQMFIVFASFQMLICLWINLQGDHDTFRLPNEIPLTVLLIFLPHCFDFEENLFCFFPSIKWKLIFIFKFNSHVGLNFDRFLALISSENTAKVESVTNKVIVRLHLPINFVRIKTLSFRNSLCASTLKVFISRQTFLEDLFVLI